MGNSTDRSQRWDDIRREQFRSINTLLLTLATGLLAFQASPLIGEQRPTGCAYWVTVFSIVVLAGSVAAGIFCAWSRLNDARLTARVTRNPADELRHSADRAGKWSWFLLKLQMGFFLAGAVLVGARILL